jgi:DNA repair photolyase
VFQTAARSILSATSGFIAQAGFTHSLTPARNCTYGCTYCYVPTLHIYAGLKREDWEKWGQLTTFKRNAAALLRRELRSGQVIYCSPLVDPYQPAEIAEQLMPGILEVLMETPPSVFVVQTRGPLVLRDIYRLRRLSERCIVRVSFSLTTDRDDVRRLYEPHCEPLEQRLLAVRELVAAGIETYPTLAPLLPCDPEALARAAIDATRADLIGDPLHVRAVKRTGATTRAAAWTISRRHGFEQWLDASFQTEVIERIRLTAETFGRRFATGPEGFSWLARK